MGILSKNLIIFIMEELDKYYNSIKNIVISDYEKKNKIQTFLKNLNTFICHGTNECFLESIQKNGLTGRTDDELYTKIKNLHDGGYSFNGYALDFINRQNDLREKNNISIYFSPNCVTSTEFGQVGSRKLGEGLGNIYLQLKETIKNEKDRFYSDNIKEQIKKLYNELDNMMKKCNNQIIISVFIKDLIKKNIHHLSNFSGNIDYYLDREINNNDISSYELVYFNIIPPEILYIYKDGKHIKISDYKKSEVSLTDEQEEITTINVDNPISFEDGIRINENATISLPNGIIINKDNYVELFSDTIVELQIIKTDEIYVSIGSTNNKLVKVGYSRLKKLKDFTFLYYEDDTNSKYYIKIKTPEDEQKDSDRHIYIRLGNGDGITLKNGTILLSNKVIINKDNFVEINVQTIGQLLLMPNGEKNNNNTIAWSNIPELKDFIFEYYHNDTYTKFFIKIM